MVRQRNDAAHPRPRCVVSVGSVFMVMSHPGSLRSCALLDAESGW
jgi:hypothetical protein